MCPHKTLCILAKKNTSIAVVFTRYFYKHIVYERREFQIKDDGVFKIVLSKLWPACHDCRDKVSKVTATLPGVTQFSDNCSFCSALWISFLPMSSTQIDCYCSEETHRRGEPVVWWRRLSIRRRIRVGRVIQIPVRTIQGHTTRLKPPIVRHNDINCS